MIHSLFSIPIYRYEVEDWSRKKKAFYKKIEEKDLQKIDLQTFYTDRQKDKKSYSLDFDFIFNDELKCFCKDSKISGYSIKDIWVVKYKKQDYQIVHNHSSTGFSGILYLEYDQKVHAPTAFVGPWNDPITDTTQISYPPSVKEGVIYIFPSALLHYAQTNFSKKERVIVSWDMTIY